MKKYKVAIIGATGVVGRSFLKVLEERNLPIDEYMLFASKESAEEEINFLGKTFMIQELTDKSFDKGFDFALFAAGGDVAKHFAPIAVSKGCIVIDNSSYFRMHENVPLIVPEVNPEKIINHKGIIANPNCSTIQAMLPLKTLDDKYSIKRIVYSTYQAVSGAGLNGILNLENGQKELSELKKFKYPIFNNCLPQIDIFLDNGYTKEEEKMINETRKILNKPDLKITATAVRVPVLNCHCENINLEFEKDFELNELINTLKNFPNIIVQNDFVKEEYPIPTQVNNHDEVYVGRIRRDYSLNSGVNLWVVADNIRKGAATNAVQILELLIK